MTDTKPLAVQVAEVLGWTECHEVKHIVRGSEWFGKRPADDHFYSISGDTVPWYAVPRYDKGGGALWPLIVRYKISLIWRDMRCEACPYSETQEDRELEEEWIRLSADPAIAACELIVALGKAGKL